MEPAVVALLATDPKIGAKADVFGCGSTLGSLLRFVRGEDRPFRILVEMVHDTVFLIRRENSPTELLSGVYGYGHTFPEAYTTWDPDVKGSASHQRLIQFSFGKLELIVRSEGDGYFAESPFPLKTYQDATADDLVPALLAAGNISETLSSGTKLKVRSAGEVVKQELVFDIKTRSIKKKGQNILAEELPRLWARHITKFVLAYHTSGVFDEIEVKDIRKDVEEWERTHNRELSKLAAVIHNIIAEVRKRPEAKLELCFDGSSRLEFREQGPGAGDALSAETKALWAKTAADDQVDVEQVDVDQADLSWAADDDFTACTEACGYCGQCTY
jgi:hypothetical protein